MEPVTLVYFREIIFRSCKRGTKYACLRYKGKKYRVFSSYYTERSGVLTVSNDFYFIIYNRQCPKVSYTRVTYVAVTV
jgi:hypothetical protein